MRTPSMDLDDGTLPWSAIWILTGLSALLTAAGTLVMLTDVALGALMSGIGMGALSLAAAYVAWQAHRGAGPRVILVPEAPVVPPSAGGTPITTPSLVDGGGIDDDDVTEIHLLRRPDPTLALRAADHRIRELERLARFGEDVAAELFELKRLVARVYAQRALCDALPTATSMRDLLAAMTDLQVRLADQPAPPPPRMAPPRPSRRAGKPVVIIQTR